MHSRAAHESYSLALYYQVTAKCMRSRAAQYGVYLFIAAVVFSGLLATDSRIRPQNGELHIVMLDVGQGDAIYIRTPEGMDMLIDGGPDRHVVHQLGSVMPPYDRSLELVIASHPDADHIAGLTELPEIFQIGTYIHSGVEKSTGFTAAIDEWPQRYGVHVLEAYRGWRLDLEQDLWLEFIHPDPKNLHEEVNDDSVMFVLHYKEFEALFTGDSSIEIEEEIIEHYGPHAQEVLESDLLKVGHHGSKTSTSQAFLNITTPEIALINVGWQNKFGHPHEGPMRRLSKATQKIFRTDIQGRIECKTDGYSVECHPQR